MITRPIILALAITAGLVLFGILYGVGGGFLKGAVRDATSPAAAATPAPHVPVPVSQETATSGQSVSQAATPINQWPQGTAEVPPELNDQDRLLAALLAPFAYQEGLNQQEALELWQGMVQLIQDDRERAEGARAEAISHNRDIWLAFEFAKLEEDTGRTWSGTALAEIQAELAAVRPATQ